jgi:hypothetical protein
MQSQTFIHVEEMLPRGRWLGCAVICASMSILKKITSELTNTNTSNPPKNNAYEPPKAHHSSHKRNRIKES